MSAAQTYDYTFRLVLVGDSGVGKTNLSLRYTANVFDDSLLGTIGVDWKTKTVQFAGKKIKV